MLLKTLERWWYDQSNNSICTENDTDSAPPDLNMVCLRCGENSIRMENHTDGTAEAKKQRRYKCSERKKAKKTNK